MSAGQATGRAATAATAPHGREGRGGAPAWPAGSATRCTCASAAPPPPRSGRTRQSRTHALLAAKRKASDAGAGAGSLQTQRSRTAPSSPSPPSVAKAHATCAPRRGLCESSSGGAVRDVSSTVPSQSPDSMRSGRGGSSGCDRYRRPVSPATRGVDRSASMSTPASSAQSRCARHGSVVTWIAPRLLTRVTVDAPCVPPMAQTPCRSAQEWPGSGVMEAAPL